MSALKEGGLTSGTFETESVIQGKLHSSKATSV